MVGPSETLLITNPKIQNLGFSSRAALGWQAASTEDGNGFSRPRVNARAAREQERADDELLQGLVQLPTNAAAAAADSNDFQSMYYIGGFTNKSHDEMDA